MGAAALVKDNPLIGLMRRWGDVVLPTVAPPAAAVTDLPGTGVGPATDFGGDHSPAPVAPGGSWHPEPPPGAHARVVAWRSPTSWLAAVHHDVTTQRGEAIRRRHHQIAVWKVLRVAREDATAADHRTGRNVSTAHATVAARAGLSETAVGRARAVLRDLGFSVTVVEGRYLTTAEREAARQHHGGEQRRCASVRDLTMPRHHFRGPRTCGPTDYLPRRGSGPLSVQGSSGSPTRALRARGAATRPKDATKKPRSTAPRPSLGLQRLAAALNQRLPWLAHGRHIGALCAALTAAGVDETWTAHDVLEVLDRRNHDQGLYALPPRAQQDPIALLVHQLRQALTTTAETPPQRRRREAAAREAARQTRDAEASRARDHAASADTVRAHTSAIRTTLRTRRRNNTP